MATKNGATMLSAGCVGCLHSQFGTPEREDFYWQEIVLERNLFFISPEKIGFFSGLKSSRCWLQGKCRQRPTREHCMITSRTYTSLRRTPLSRGSVNFLLPRPLRWR